MNIFGTKTVSLNIFSFLPLSDLIKFREVCISWLKILNSSSLFQKLIYNEVWPQLIFISYVHKYFPMSLNLMDIRQIWTIDHINLLCSIKNKNLKELYFMFDFNDNQEQLEIMIKINYAFPNVENLKISGKDICDESIEILKNMEKLKKISIYCEDSFFTGIFLSELPPLDKLILRPYNLKYENLSKILIKSSDKMKKLGFDCENFNEKEVNSLLNNCKIIENLSLYHCENLYDNFLDNISVFPIKKLIITKGNNFSSKGLFIALKYSNWNIEKIYLPECSNFNDDCIEIISEKFKNLRKINLAWCEQISSYAFGKMWNFCKNLETIIVRGIKSMNENMFPFLKEMGDHFNEKLFFKDKINGNLKNNGLDIYYESKLIEENIKMYKKLRFLDLTSCDFVPDKLIWMLKLINRKAKILNYYGEEVEF